MKCSSVDQLLEELKREEAEGGEGLVLRKPGSPYVNGRSDVWQKVKSFHEGYAEVIGYVPSTANSDYYGSLICLMESGKIFRVGSGMTKEDKANPPKKGSIIHYRFQELLLSGVPRFPTYESDMIWWSRRIHLCLRNLKTILGQTSRRIRMKNRTETSILNKRQSFSIINWLRNIYLCCTFYSCLAMNTEDLQTRYH